MEERVYRPTFTSEIYFAIEKYEAKSRKYPAGDELEFLNTKPTWVGYFPEEVGYSYQALCYYVKRHHNCAGGMKVDVDGTVTLYTLKQLHNDYDPSEEK